MIVWAKTIASPALGGFLVVCTVAGCNEIASFSLEPYSDVSVVVSARKVSYHELEIRGRTTFVHLRFVVTARSDTPLFFKVNDISLSVNGQKNRGAYYDSVASFAPLWRLLKKGETIIDAYAIFPGTVDTTEVPNLKFIDLGFSRNPENRSGTASLGSATLEKNHRRQLALAALQDVMRSAELISCAGRTF